MKDIEGIKLMDSYLQEQLLKVLSKSVTDSEPKLNTSADFVQISFNFSPDQVTTTNETNPTSTNTSVIKPNDTLNVSHCYPTKEWRCLYRCEIDSSNSNKAESQIPLTLFGSVNNSTDEDWKGVELKLVANELEILNNNKTTTTAPTKEKKSEAVSSGSMAVYVKTLTGKTITIEVRTVLSEFAFLVCEFENKNFYSIGEPIGYNRIC